MTAKVTEEPRGGRAFTRSGAIGMLTVTVPGLVASGAAAALQHPVQADPAKVNIVGAPAPTDFNPVSWQVHEGAVPPAASRLVGDAQIRNAMLDKAESLVGVTPGGSANWQALTNGQLANVPLPAWCAIFATDMVHTGYAAFGLDSPISGGSTYASADLPVPDYVLPLTQGTENDGIVSIEQFGLQTDRLWYLKDNPDKQPLPADLVLIRHPNGGWHVGMVINVDANGTLHTVEGNVANNVAYGTYPNYKSDSTLIAFMTTGLLGRTSIEVPASGGVDLPAGDGPMLGWSDTSGSNQNQSTSQTPPSTDPGIELGWGSTPTPAPSASTPPPAAPAPAPAPPSSSTRGLNSDGSITKDYELPSTIPADVRNLVMKVWKDHFQNTTDPRLVIATYWAENRQFKPLTTRSWSQSWALAQGPWQVIPSTWNEYLPQVRKLCGCEPDINNPYQAVYVPFLMFRDTMGLPLISGYHGDVDGNFGSVRYYHNGENLLSRMADYNGSGAPSGVLLKDFPRSGGPSENSDYVRMGYWLLGSNFQKTWLSWNGNFRVLTGVSGASDTLTPHTEQTVVTAADVTSQRAYYQLPAEASSQFALVTNQVNATAILSAADKTAITDLHLDGLDGSIVTQRQVYAAIGKKHDVPWQIVAAVDWLQTKCNPRLSPTTGSVLLPGISRVKALDMATEDLVDNARDYNVTLNATSNSVKDVTTALAAYRYGLRLMLEGTDPESLPELMSGFDSAHEMTSSIGAVAVTFGLGAQMNVDATGIAV